MPRDLAGNYTLPSPLNPVVTGTTITTVWWNTTGGDLATAMGNSLDRTGVTGGMTGQLKSIDGSSSGPGLTFGSETNSGFYRPTSGEMDVVITGTRLSRWTTGAGFQESPDNGSTWFAPFYVNSTQSNTTGTTDFTLGTLLVGGVPVRAGGQPVVTKSSSSGTFSTTSTSFVAVTNLTLTFTAIGGPVHIQLISDDTSSSAYLQAGNSNTSNLTVAMDVALTTDGGSTFFARQQFGNYATGLSGTTVAAFTGVTPVSAYSAWFSPSAGSVTVKVYIKSATPTAGTTQSIVNNAMLCLTQF